MSDNEEVSPDMEVEEAGAQTDEGNVVLMQDDTTQIHRRMPALFELLSRTCTIDNWSQFEELVDRIMEDGKRVAKIPERAKETR